MAWKPPTEEEFDKNWLPPFDLIGNDANTPDKLRGQRRWVMDRLKSGVIVAVARTASQLGKPTRSLELVKPELWEGYSYDAHFWQYGDATFTVAVDNAGYHYTDLRCLGIRVDPDRLDGRVHVTQTAAPVPEPSASDAILPQLPNAEADRVSRLILAAYGTTVTEVRAVELARVLCAGYRLSRDPFLVRFRLIRGDKKPGKVPLNGE